MKFNRGGFGQIYALSKRVHVYLDFSLCSSHE